MSSSDAVRALAAELGHDLQNPLNLLRASADRASSGQQLDAEDLAALVEAVDGLRGMSARLRELARSSFAPELVSVQELGRRALAGRDPACCTLELAADAPELRCDARLLGAALAALLDNALAAKASRAGLRFVTGPRAGFCVWDDGAGFALPPADAQRWGVSTRAGACGLGLVVAQRAARAHGFWLELRREHNLTETWILLENGAPQPPKRGAP